MRELAIRIRFTSPCLGHVQRQLRERGKKRLHWLMPRNPDGKVVFLNTWWRAILHKAAEILCKHQREINEIRFAPEVEGEPRAVPREYHVHFHRENRFSKHEAFFAGDVIGIQCVVPSAISDDDFHRLLTYAGKYSGISPSHPGEYGFFTVESVRPMSLTDDAQQRREENDLLAQAETEKIRPPDRLARSDGPVCG